MLKMRTVLIVLLVVLAILVLAFGLETLSLKWKSYFNPKHEEVRRKVFKATRSFNEGKVQELSKYRLEYLRSQSEDEKEAIASTIRMTFADYDTTKLNMTLQRFLKQILN